MNDAHKEHDGSGWIDGIDRRLEVMSPRPLVLSTPVGLLGEHRAIDALGRSQPLDGSIFWNPNGYEWTGVFKNTLTVEA